MEVSLKGCPVFPMTPPSLSGTDLHGGEGALAGCLFTGGAAYQAVCWPARLLLYQEVSAYQQNPVRRQRSVKNHFYSFISRIPRIAFNGNAVFFSTSKDFRLLIIFVFVCGPFLERDALAVLLIYPIYLNACSKSSSGIPIGQKVKFEVQTLYYRVRQHYYKLPECFKIE